MTEYLEGVCKRNCSGLNVPCTKECAIPKGVNEVSDETEQLGTIIITDTVEHEDGSATYTFDMDDASSKKITELGLEFILTCAAYGLDIQDALTHLCELGKSKEANMEHEDD